jgi:hypothetical protein
MSANPRAVALVSGLTVSQLLTMCETNRIGHPGRLAQALGLDGKGSATEVATRIAAIYG